MSTRRHIRRMLGALVAAAAAAGCTAPAVPGIGATTAAPETAVLGTAVPGSPLPAPVVAGIEQVVHDQMRAGAVPGMAVGVWIPGQGALVQAYGVGDVTTGVPFAVQDRVRIASITKTFTATAALMLVDRGRLRLDDRVDRFVSGVPNGAAITVRQLLTMTAGIYDYALDPAFVAAFDADPGAPVPLDEVLAIVARHPPAFAPGKPGSWQYSDTNYVLLGRIIEIVAGEPAGVFIEREIVAPLRLNGTTYPAGPDIPAPAARGYAIVAAGAAERDVTAVNPQVPGAAGAMISTLDGLHTWATALADGRLLSAVSHREQTTFTDTKLSPVLHTGYGAGVFQINDFVGHNGAIYGYNTAMFQLPATGATIVVIANKSTNFDGVALQTFLSIAKFLYPQKFPR